MDDDGFQSVTRLAEARERLRSVCPPHDRQERVSVAAADGRVLAADVAAARAAPHYERAAMDGFAVRAQDTFGAGERSPVDLTLVADDDTAGTDAAGGGGGEAAVGPREAVPVHTGSPLPEGADAVVMVEYTERRGGTVEIRDAVAEGENVAPVGEDVAAGEPLFEAGRWLRPSDLALLRSTGHERVPVAARPRVSVVPTGEELVDAGQEPEPGEVVETNGLMVATLAERWGGAATYRNVVTDHAPSLRAAIERDIDHDLVVTTGGSSVGERDLVPEVVDERGEMLVHGVALKPGHPAGFGVVEGTPVLVLPGYPVSCLVAAVQLLRPAIAWAMGTAPRPHPTVRGRLSEKVASEVGRRSFVRVRVQGSGPADPSESAGDETIPAVEPVSASGAGVLSSVTGADGWVEVPESREGLPAGETVSVQQWEP